MKVLMQKATYFEGVKKAGETHNIPESVARRWFSAGIAVQAEEFIDIGDDELEDLPKSIDEMTAKELYAECIKQGIEAEKQKSKAYYIELLTKTDDSDGDEKKDDTEE